MPFTGAAYWKSYRVAKARLVKSHSKRLADVIGPKVVAWHNTLQSLYTVLHDGTIEGNIDSEQKSTVDDAVRLIIRAGKDGLELAKRIEHCATDMMQANTCVNENGIFELTTLNMDGYDELINAAHAALRATTLVQFLSSSSDTCAHCVWSPPVFTTNNENDDEQAAIDGVVKALMTHSITMQDVCQLVMNACKVFNLSFMPYAFAPHMTTTTADSVSDTVVTADSASDTVVAADSASDTVVAADSVSDTVVAADSASDTVIAADSASDTVIAVDDAKSV